MNKSILNIFTKKHAESLDGSDLSGIPEKYLSAKKLFYRFWPVINEIKKNGFIHGLDFGCGVGAASVLGNIMGINIVGVDIPSYKDKENPYSKVHENLVKMGLPIHIIDTAKYPWSFKDKEFQFVLGFCSIGKDNSPNSEKDKNEMDGAEWVDRRISEIIRVSNNKSIWYLGPKTTISFVRKVKSFKNKNKVILLKDWPI